MSIYISNYFYNYVLKSFFFYFIIGNMVDNDKYYLLLNNYENYTCPY